MSWDASWWKSREDMGGGWGGKVFSFPGKWHPTPRDSRVDHWPQDLPGDQSITISRSIHPCWEEPEGHPRF